MAGHGPNPETVRLLAALEANVRESEEETRRAQQRTGSFAGDRTPLVGVLMAAHGDELGRLLEQLTAGELLDVLGDLLAERSAVFV